MFLNIFANVIYSDIYKGISDMNVNNIKSVMIAVVGGIILSFGLYNVHSPADITEGGTLGLTLLLEYLFSISPAVSGFVLNAVCYILGIKIFGKRFAVFSLISALSFSLSYNFFEMFPPLWENIYMYPSIACIIGALFVGVGAGICVAVGGAPSGDDALAMSLSRITGIDIKWIYLISDIIVLSLSLIYIPLNRIIFSLITVIISGQIIGYIQRLEFFVKKY